MKIIAACFDCVIFLHLQPEKMAEGLLLFIQGLGLGKISILHVFSETQVVNILLCQRDQTQQPVLD